MEKQERFIQVGVTALRDPAVPLYIKAEDGAEESASGLTQDIGKLLAERMRRYKEACEAAGVAV